MELNSKNQKLGTPVKDSHAFYSKCENINPNVCRSSPGPKSTGNSPLIKSGKTHKSGYKNPIGDQNPLIFSPRNKIRERKFVVAKKNSKKGKEKENVNIECKCKDRFGGNVKKCLCMAYESLRTSQEDFFKSRNGEEEKVRTDEEKAEEEKDEKIFIDQTMVIGNDNVEVNKGLIQPGISTIKRRRERLIEPARNGEPECGKVMHLVKAFEKILTMPTPKESDKEEEEEINEVKKKVIQWPLQRVQPPKVAETEISSDSFTSPEFQPPIAPDTQVSSSLSPSDLFLTSENLGLEPRLSVYSSWGSSHGSSSSGTSINSRRSRRNSSESCGTMGGRRWKMKQMKITSQKPFKLRTEQRGRIKEEEFKKKLQDKMAEEEKLRIPVAQGLPWTTDEPECLIKPPVKENTRPVDLKLHTDVRAVERAGFDDQVAEKLCMIEQYKMERERQHKMEEEEEIRRLRKELVPRAQPMPYFDRPFIPRRSMKNLTVPREPKFHIPLHKKMKSGMSWTDMGTYTFQS